MSESERIKIIVAAALAVAKRRFVDGDMTRLQPCWCEIPGDKCVNQNHCEQARLALKEAK